MKIPNPQGIKDLISLKYFQLIAKALSTNISFGKLITGTTYVNENIDGQLLVITGNAIANTETGYTHKLNRVPIGYIVCWSNVAAIVYQGPTTGTAWTTTQIFLKTNVANSVHLLFIF